MSEVPSERDILKQQLWVRDEQVREANEQAIKDIYSRLDNFYAKVEAALGKDLDKARLDIDGARGALNKSIEQAESRLNAISERSSSDFRSKLDTYVRNNDKRLSEFEYEVRAKIEREVRSYYEALTREVKDLSKKVDAYRSDIIDSTKVCQQEIRDKAGEAKKLSLEIKEKFRHIAETLA